MFKKILIEKSLYHSANSKTERAKKIIQFFPKAEVLEIESYENYFNKVFKPYLQKRDNLNLFLAEKKGQLIRKAPPAYGTLNEDHYFFIHAYNCIYECEYCYLQGYFNSPDLVLFLNHEEILQEMTVITQNHKDDIPLWFHAGEFSDSLALSHITQEIPMYWDFFTQHKATKLELRTKSANIKSILQCPPIDNVFISFSMAPKEMIKSIEHKTAPYQARLNAIKELLSKGYQVGLHFDPIVYHPDLIQMYQTMIADMVKTFDITKISYISMGVVRFTKDVIVQVEKNYPDSFILQQEMTKTFDNKIRYNRPFRMWILNQVKELLVNAQVAEAKIYFCME